MPEPVVCVHSRWCIVWCITVLLCLFIIIGILSGVLGKTSSFSNPNDSQYNQRFVAADVPVAAQQSLNDRLMAATAGIKAASSSMTGYRDSPVFWEGDNTDMNRVNGNVYNSRESPMSSFSNINDKDCGRPGGC
jgi:hypothetical protein